MKNKCSTMAIDQTCFIQNEKYSSIFEIETRYDCNHFGFAIFSQYHGAFSLYKLKEIMKQKKRYQQNHLFDDNIQVEICDTYLYISQNNQFQSFFDVPAEINGNDILFCNNGFVHRETGYAWCDIVYDTFEYYLNGKIYQKQHYMLIML